MSAVCSSSSHLCVFTTSFSNDISDITDVSEVEYWKLRTVLLRLESPAQLHEIETNSPQIRGEDAELWRNFIARDFPRWELKNYVPKNPLKWYQVYLKYKKEQQLEIAKDEEILRASMGQLKKAKETNVSKVVDLRALPKVPRDPWMMATNGGVPISRGAGLFKKEGPSSLVWSAGSKTKLTNGKSVLTRARREAKEISQRGKLAKPTHELRAQAGQVRKAPAGMVNDYRRASEPPIKILSRKKIPVGNPSSSTGRLSLEERESRLSAAQSGVSQQKYTARADETLIGSSDEEEELDTDVTFNERPKARPRPATSSPHLSAASPHTSASPSRPVASSSSQRPTSNPPRPLSSLSGTATKPSSYTSPATNRPTAAPRPAGSPPSSTSPAAQHRSPSPSHGEKRPTVGVVRRRVEVDIFNRGPAKKPRVR